MEVIFTWEPNFFMRSSNSQQVTISLLVKLLWRGNVWYQHKQKYGSHNRSKGFENGPSFTRRCLCGGTSLLVFFKIQIWKWSLACRKFSLKLLVNFKSNKNNVILINNQELFFFDRLFASLILVKFIKWRYILR